MADRTAKGMKIGTRGPRNLTVYVEYLSRLILWVQFGVIRCTLKISDIKIFKKLLLLPVFSQFQRNFMMNMLLMGEYRLFFFWQSAKEYKFYDTFKLNFLSTQHHIGLEISAYYSSYSFRLISPKLYEDSGHHNGIQAVTFHDNRPIFKNVMALWNVNMGVNGKS